MTSPAATAGFRPSGLDHPTPACRENTNTSARHRDSGACEVLSIRRKAGRAIGAVSRAYPSPCKAGLAIAFMVQRVGLASTVASLQAFNLTSHAWRRHGVRGCADAAAAVDTLALTAFAGWAARPIATASAAKPCVPMTRKPTLLGRAMDAADAAKRRTRGASGNGRAAPCRLRSWRPARRAAAPAGGMRSPAAAVGAASAAPAPGRRRSPKH